MRSTFAGRAAGSSDPNKLLPDDRPIHDWYRFVLSFPPHLVRTYLDRFGAQPDQRVLDPFCGTGTTLVEAKKLGLPSVGVEANPVAYFAATVKTDWAVDPEGLEGHAEEVVALAQTLLQQSGVSDDPVAEAPSPELLARLVRLPEPQERLLLTHSISPLPLHKVLMLRSAIAQLEDERFSRYERLALAKTAVFFASNLHFGPEVGVGARKTDAAVLRPWYDVTRKMAADVRTFRDRRDVPTMVLLGDARTALSHLEPESIDIVITSPPYPNEKDYTRTTRLEAVLLGFLVDRADLRSLKRRLLRSNSRGVYRDDDDDRWVSADPEIRALAERIEARRIALGKTSGFERMYARVIGLYFGGMMRHLADLRFALRPGARLAYVVGDQASYFRIPIRTGQILARLAAQLGYQVESIDLFRTRLATATRAQLREEVVVLRWPGARLFATV